MILGGLRKISLIDYPGEVGCTVFTRGCNFRCPWCHNKELVFGDSPNLNTERFFDFLKKRKGKLEAVCITGGEPLIQKDIGDFIRKIKGMDYKIKLDTNGSFPTKLRDLISETLIDFVAMDIKSSPENYSRETGKNLSLEKIRESIELIKSFDGKKEFRTTMVPTLSIKDMKSIAGMLGEDQSLTLQKFKVPEGKELIDPNYKKKIKKTKGPDLEEIVLKLSPKLRKIEVRK